MRSLMSFVSLPSSTQAEAKPIANDGFFPDIALADIRIIGRVITAVDDDCLRATVIAAIVTVARDLTSWAEKQKAAGHATLADVPAPRIDGKSRLIHLYIRAVALFAKAELVDRLRDFDTTAAGGKSIDELGGTADDLRRDATHAIRDILGTLRTKVELI